jgi:hypothetical protein
MKPKTPEQLAANRLAEAIQRNVDLMHPAECAVAAFSVANRTEGALQGLIRLLVHKGILSQAELGDSIAWGMDHRTGEIDVNVEKGSILLPTAAPHARGSN